MGGNMRVTESMITRNLLKNIQQSRENMSSLQTSVATGKEVRQSSDDPVNFSKASRFKDTINKNRQYLNTIQYAKGWIGTTNSVLDQINEELQDTRELATQAADLAGDNEATRNTLAAQVDNVIEELVSLGNTTYMNKYLFGGTVTKGESPFVYDGDQVSYRGNDSDMIRRVADNFNVAINAKGTQLIENNVFTALIDFRDALVNNDRDQIRASIDDLRDTSEQVLSMMSTLGSLEKQLKTTEQRLETANLNLQSYLSDVQDTDMAEAITQYNAEEMAYKAALETTSSALNLNILNFIR